MVEALQNGLHSQDPPMLYGLPTMPPPPPHTTSCTVDTALQNGVAAISTVSTILSFLLVPAFGCASCVG